MHEEIIDPEKDTDLKKPMLSPDQVRKWLSRAKACLKHHHNEIIPKYREAKKRYNSEIGYTFSISKDAKHRHTDINMLFKDVKEFLAAVYNRNPKIDLVCRSEDDGEIRNIENLEQAVNDDIADNETEIKGTIRSGMIDEYLSSIGVFYIDYAYHEASGDEMTSFYSENRVILKKIKPENLIRPKNLDYYDYRNAPFLGYCEIIPIEDFKNDKSLDQTLVTLLKGKEYKSLVEADIREMSGEDKSVADELLYEKKYCLFIKGSDGGPLKRLVLVDDEDLRGQPLAYDDFDKGHGYDNRGYPIHILQLNDPADGFLAPSQAWILIPLLQIIDYIYEKLNKHLKKSSSRTYGKTGQGSLDKAEVNKAIKNNDLEFIGVDGLAPGIDLRSVLMQITDQPLAQDHMQMFEMTRQIFDELSRMPSFAKGQVLGRDKTAAESNAIQQSDATANGDFADKIKDFMKCLFFDWAKLLQRNMQGARDVSVIDKKTGDKDGRFDLTAENFQGKFKSDIDIETMIAPNKLLKQRMAEEVTVKLATIFDPLLKQSGKRINAIKLVDFFILNTGIRNPQDIVIDMPVRGIDQQVTDLVFHNVPMNPEELGEDYEKSLQRLMQIFGDGVMMNEYENIRPGIGGPESELIIFAKVLEEIVKNQKAGLSKGQASTPTKALAPLPVSDASSNSAIQGNLQSV